MQAVLEQEARIAGFKSEVSKSQELHLASLTRDTERLTNNLEKIRAEIRPVTHSPVSGSLLNLPHQYSHERRCVLEAWFR